MTTPHVTDAVLHVIKGAGYSLGETTTIQANGTTRHVLNAVDARTGESFTAAGPDEYDALVELAGQVAVKQDVGVVHDDCSIRRRKLPGRFGPIPIIDCANRLTRIEILKLIRRHEDPILIELDRLLAGIRFITGQPLVLDDAPYLDSACAGGVLLDKEEIYPIDRWIRCTHVGVAENGVKSSGAIIHALLPFDLRAGGP